MTRGRFSISPCAIGGVEAVSADTAHAFGRHTHDRYGIGVILRGAQKSASGRGVVEAEAGDIITVNSGEVHDGTPLGEGGRAWRMLYVEPALLRGENLDLTAGLTAAAELARPTLRDPACAARFLALFRSLTDPQGGHSEIEAQEQMLVLLARLIETGSAQRRCGAAPLIGRARKRIDDDPAAPLSLDELAAIEGLGRYQLIRGFAKTTGLTPHAYLVQRRLQRARRLIAGGATLAAAAFQSGFADQSHLNRHFVRAYGLSPGRYAAVMR